jgi:sugar transferase (PEP-CTERM/EpsH1 system associated)
MRIFYVCRRVPFPPDRGDKIATFNQIRHLAARHEVHVFCLGDGARDLDNIAGLQNLTASVTAVAVGGPQIRLRAAKGLICGRPLSVAALDEPALHTAIRGKFAALRPDLILVYSGNVAQFAEPFTQVPRVIQFGDLDSLKWRQYAEHSRPPSRWIYGTEARRLRAYERHIAQSFSHSVVHTNGEKRDFERLMPGVAVAVVGNGVDLDYFRSAGAAKQPGSTIFTGVMDYRPNIDAVLRFCEEILPLVQAEIPAATFTICGSRPVAAVRRLAQRKGVIVTGAVPDTRPYLDRAEVFAAPLRMARGIQNKLLEALAMGLPCVASPVAVSGTAIREGDGMLAADQPRQFAAHIIRLLRDGQWRSEMAHRARAVAEAQYRWDAQLARLDEVIATVVSQWMPLAASAWLERA